MKSAGDDGNGDGVRVSYAFSFLGLSRFEPHDISIHNCKSESFGRWLIREKTSLTFHGSLSCDVVRYQSPKQYP